MFKKRFYHFKRAKKALCMEIFLPLILLVFGCIFGLKLQMFKLSPTLVFSDDFYPTK
jgi:hypothetical protein